MVNKLIRKKKRKKRVPKMINKLLHSKNNESSEIDYFTKSIKT